MRITTTNKPFCQEMLEKLLALPISKRAVSQATHLSIASINAILAGKILDLRFATFRRLLTMYATKILTKD